MNDPISPPEFPAGPVDSLGSYDADEAARLIGVLKAAPARLKEAVAGLSEDQLDTRYKNWTIRQIVHHLADSHVHGYVRMKLAVTEPRPSISPFDENQWVLLVDSVYGPVEPSLVLLEGLHTRWAHFLESLAVAEFEHTFYHPQQKAEISVWEALSYLAFHCRHHTGQIEWLRQQHNW